MKTTILLLDDAGRRFCIVTTHFGGTTPANVNSSLRRALAEKMGLPASHVWIFTSHNHSSVNFAANPVPIYDLPARGCPPVDWLPIGERFLAELLRHAEGLAGLLKPVTVWWAEGAEDRITYNRKGRRADGTTFFMREEDRALAGGLPRRRGHPGPDRRVQEQRGPEHRRTLPVHGAPGHQLPSGKARGLRRLAAGRRRRAG